MNLRMRQLYDQSKDAVLDFYRKLSSGVSFKDIAERSLDLVERIFPQSMQYPVEIVVIYVLFHLYLLYAILYSVAKLVVTHTRVKGAKFVPVLPAVDNIKEKMYLFLTSLFVVHWLLSLFPLSMVPVDWQTLTGWILNVRPQINIKPQLKVVTRTNSCHSVHSNVSFSMDPVSTGMSLSFEPSDKASQAALRTLQTAQHTASFATDVAASVIDAASRSNSRESTGSWESFDSETFRNIQDDADLDMDEEMNTPLEMDTMQFENDSFGPPLDDADDTEIDMDEEMDKALATAQVSELFGSASGVREVLDELRTPEKTSNAEPIKMFSSAAEKVMKQLNVTSSMRSSRIPRLASPVPRSRRASTGSDV